MSFTMAPLGDICLINPSPPSDLGDDVAFVPMASVSEDGTMTVSEHRSPSALSNGLSYFQNGDILVAKITPCYENNKIALAKLDREHGFGSTEFHVVRPNAKMLDARYLFYFLRQDKIRQMGKQRMTGSAGQQRVPKQFLASLEIPLPLLDEQRRIAAILDQADALRRKRRLAQLFLKRLSSSIFLEMFGDPARNPKRWRTMRLGDAAVRFSDGPFGSNLKSEHYVTEGVRVVRLQNIGENEFVDTDKAYITAAHFEGLKKHMCLPGDVLVGTLGDPNLRACIQPSTISVALNKADCVQMRVNKTICTPEYVATILNLPSVERMAQSSILGQTRLRISMGRLRELELPFAPMELQLSYSDRFHNIERLKAETEDSLRKVESLFAAIQQAAFTSETPPSWRAGSRSQRYSAAAE